ncbi:hypothetical protein H5S40_04230 [Limosilactobacillus sp. RRLNB_1_1]|uniref:Uncharacterized protein n=1 Tax=Limosilactobacillus albertensis TaxID=2759752 RepID=A0A7W3TRD8_9LACO|nr:hypothetical protein [Limosilactobacillus albertensis]MBB1069363.1 hypothetical protein [Limosilactobacillus albertensis]MCD7118605.1 hypothetical protein [Limosilactobacillus albertensis]MCD7128350.1 hypothetical protein [Limosilactobacillus albertensis]
MLERYFKSEQDFNEYLDRTYDPVSFEHSFEHFLNSLASSAHTFDVNVKVNNFRNIVDSISTYKLTNNLTDKTISKNEDSFSFC